MKKTKIIYYIFTVLFSLSISVGAYLQLTGADVTKEIILNLGYPLYLNYILGVAKILGVIAIWQTPLPFLVEWAYAGFVFDLLGGISSHVAIRDLTPASIFAGLNFVFAIISYGAYKKINLVDSKEKITKMHV